MAESQARIDAALRLAESVDAAARACDALDGTPPDVFQRTFNARCQALEAYRATLPKLRTRAEVDAEIATLVRDYHQHITRPGWKETPDWDSFSDGEKRDLNRLCAEPTAPEEP